MQIKVEIAEIGCGPGRSAYMTEMGLSVTALDLSDYSLELRKRSPKGSLFLVIMLIYFFLQILLILLFQMVFIIQ